MKRIGLLCGAVTLTFVGALPAAPAVAQPTPEPSGPTQSHHADMLKDVLHGEGIVQTKRGPVRVAIQNGEATKVSATSVTVRSSDGFTRTWQTDRDQTGRVSAGAEVTVAGTAGSATSTTWTAKRVVVRTPSSESSSQPEPAES